MSCSGKAGLVQLSSTTTVHDYEGGIKGSAVRHYKIRDFEHSVPDAGEMGARTADVIW